MRWLVDQIINGMNLVPEFIVSPGDPRFDVLRWWLVSVIVLVLASVSAMIWRASKK